MRCRDKDEREFNLVFDVKSDGMFHLLHAIGDMPLGAMVGFSSIAGPVRQRGPDRLQLRQRPAVQAGVEFPPGRGRRRARSRSTGRRGRGIGMATRGSIPKVMEMAGIDMLPPEAGVPWIRRELTAAGTSGEVLVGAGLGALLKDLDDTGGLDRRHALPAGR